MRRAMICVSVMLAILQIWPLVFGQPKTAVEVAERAATSTAHAATIASSQLVPAVAEAGRKPVQLAVQAAAPAAKMTCYRHYEIAYAACTPGDRACRMQAADNWDLCEATGLWGN